MKVSHYLVSLALALALSVSPSTHAQRVVGYYGQTAGGCLDYPPFEPSSLPVDLYTHLNFAFALIDGNGLIASQEAKEIPKYQQVNDLKRKKPSLRTAVTVGGWDMDMANYSTMVSTRENRQKFIQSAIAFVRKYGFDGLDFDWEYPGDHKRGGHPEDAENFVVFLQEMREAANAEILEGDQERLILSIALPGGPFHGDNFLVPKLAPHVDWFNIMAYNLHGQWESQVFCAAPLNDPASGTEYSGYSLAQAIQSMAPKSVDPEKFNLGLSLSGVTFTLKDKSKTLPGSPANGPGQKGCQEKGAMSFFEVDNLMNLSNSESSSKPDAFNRRITQAPTLDDKSQCVYMVLDHDQWVGFDTPETFSNKIDFSRKYGFGGVSIWSMDSDTSDHRLTKSIYKAINSKGHLSSSSLASVDQMSHKNSSARSGATTDKNVADQVPGVLLNKPANGSTAGGRHSSTHEIISAATVAAFLAFVANALVA
ncbi:hypothetical protein EC991_000823 [Linnemannia zychae]|nr:hypothetical protein EC991_000823 [Linnemannia zychae]